MNIFSLKGNEIDCLKYIIDHSSPKWLWIGQRPLDSELLLEKITKETIEEVFSKKGQFLTIIANKEDYLYLVQNHKQLRRIIEHYSIESIGLVPYRYDKTLPIWFEELKKVLKDKFFYLINYNKFALELKTIEVSEL